jgi:phosphoribosylglycinamide formyltransferase
MTGDLHSSPTKITVLISGSGTNLQALIDACSGGLLPSAAIARVVSNRRDAQGLRRTEKALIPTTYHNLISGQYHRKGEKDPALLQKAREAYNADLARLVL